MFESPVPLLDSLMHRAGQAVVAAQARVAHASDTDLAAGAMEVEVAAACEQIAHMVSAVQLQAIASLDARRSATHLPDDPSDPVSVDRAARAVERSVRAEVSMARGVSTEAARRSHDLARSLRHHPRTQDLLGSGAISSAVARAVCRETDALPPALRSRVDRDLASVLPELTLRQAGGEARRLALALDPDGAELRAERARTKRSVRLRRNADAMATISVYGPADQVVAAWNHLARQTVADQAAGRAAGRTGRQVTCDLALGALREGETTGGAPSAEIGLLMRPEVLFGAEDTPAVLEGYGPIPAGLARQIATGAAEDDQAWVRRLFTTPSGDRVTGLDNRRRRFPAGLARLIRAADDTCLRPECDDDVRDLDHIHAHARGGPSTADNGCGLCQADNLLKEMRGWSVTPISDGTASDNSGSHYDDSQQPDRLADGVRWRTPTGHTYTTRRARPGGVRGPARTVPRTASRTVPRTASRTVPRTASRTVPRTASRASGPPPAPDSLLENHLHHLVGHLRQ